MKPGDLVCGSTFLWSSSHEEDDIKFQRATFDGDCYLVIGILHSMNRPGDLWVKVLHRGTLGWGLGSDMEVIEK